MQVPVRTQSGEVSLQEDPTLPDLVGDKIRSTFLYGVHRLSIHYPGPFFNYLSLSTRSDGQIHLSVPESSFGKITIPRLKNAFSTQVYEGI